MWKTPNMPKKWLSLKNKGLVPTILPEPDIPFLQACRNVELITLLHMKFQDILMTGCKIKNKKLQKCSQNGFSPPFVTPKIVLKNLILPLLYPYGALTSCKKN